jgi:hypothetical protein
MKTKNFIVLFIALTLGCIATSGVYAEIAKEGSGDYRGGKSGTFEILKLGENRLQMNYKEAGVFTDAPEDSPLAGTSYYAIGTLYAIEGKFKSTGGIVFTRPNGDQFFGLLNSTGVLGVGATGGAIKFTGGTGECSNIEGTMEFMQRPKVKSSHKGTYQGIGVGKVTWKIP